MARDGAHRGKTRVIQGVLDRFVRVGEVGVGGRRPLMGQRRRWAMRPSSAPRRPPDSRSGRTEARPLQDEGKGVHGAVPAFPRHPTPRRPPDSRSGQARLARGSAAKRRRGSAAKRRSAGGAAQRSAEAPAGQRSEAPAGQQRRIAAGEPKAALLSQHSTAQLHASDKTEAIRSRMGG